MKVEISINPSLVTSCVESALKYVREWATVTMFERSEHGPLVTFVESDTGREYRLSCVDWTHALRGMARDKHPALGVLMTERDYDGITGLQLVNYAAFGEIKYV